MDAALPPGRSLVIVCSSMARRAAAIRISFRTLNLAVSGLLALAAAWSLGPSPAGARPIVVTRPEVVVTVIGAGSARAGKGRQVDGLELDAEFSDDSPPKPAFQSVRSRVDIDCATRRDRITKLERFALPRLGGEPQPAPDAPIAPAPARPQAVVAIVAKASPAIHPSAPPAVGPLAAKSLALVALDVAPRGPSSKGPWVQIASADTSALAQGALKRLDALIGGRATRVDTAMVRGHTRYRAIISGFASLAEARAFCDSAPKQAPGCFAVSPRD